MAALASAPWPWYVAGPAIGLFVPALLILGNKVFGVSSSLRHLCSALLPGRLEYFRYDWKRTGLWNLVFVGGILLGGLLSAHWGAPRDVAISEQTRLALARLGIQRLLRAGAARTVLLARVAYAQGFRLGDCGRLPGRLRHGLCRRLRLPAIRSQAFRNCGCRR